jgi:hypothetical protein
MNPFWKKLKQDFARHLVTGISCKEALAMNTFKISASPQQTALTGLATLCLLALLVTPTAGFAQQMPPENRNRFEAHLGAHSWPALADLDSSYGGAFDSSGFDLGLGMYWGDLATSCCLWGMDLTLFYTEGNIRGEFKNLASRGLHLVPSVKIPVGDNRRFYLDAGLGLYTVDFRELGCVETDACFGDNDAWQSTRLGGYVGTSKDLPLGKSRIDLNLAFRIHYANFGTPDGLGPSPGELNGPIFMFLIGIGM